MPYWGANVRNDDFVVQAKIHGEAGAEPASDDLVEFISNITQKLNVEEYDLAKFYAEKIAAAFKDYPLALWVTVDILSVGGRTFGETRMIKELD